MKVFLILLLLTYGVSTQAAEVPPKASMQTKSGLYVDAKEAYAMMQKAGEEKVVLIDIRDPVEIKFTGYTEMADIHVPWKIIDHHKWDEKKQSYGGSLNKVFADDVSAALKALNVGKQDHLIFMCRSGSTRSAPAADVFYDMGYKNVYSMVDGFEGGKAKEGLQKGARVVNGWKNSQLPWGWKLEKDVAYGIAH